MNMVQFACFSAILARFCFNKRSVCLKAFVSSRQKVIVERRPEWEDSLVLFKTACATVLKPTSLDHYSRRQLVCCTCMDKLVNQCYRNRSVRNKMHHCISLREIFGTVQAMVTAERAVSYQAVMGVQHWWIAVSTQSEPIVSQCFFLSLSLIRGDRLALDYAMYLTRASRRNIDTRRRVHFARLLFREDLRHHSREAVVKNTSELRNKRCPLNSFLLSFVIVYVVEGMCVLDPVL